MKLSSLWPAFSACNGRFFSENYRAQWQDCCVSMLTQDSRQVQPGALFFYNGANPAFVKEAEQKGALAIVCVKDYGCPCQIIVKEVRRVYALACNLFYGKAAERLCMAAVTGTNGKTSVAFLLHHILTKAGFSVGLISTVCCKVGCATLDSQYTTPDAAQLHQLLQLMEQAGCTHVVMEASSHALEQQRLAGCTFACGIFTQLSPEHLDYHKNMESYYAAKRKLFSQCKQAVLNGDNNFGRRLAEEVTCPYVLYSAAGSTDAWCRARQVNFWADGSSFLVACENETAAVNLALPGDFSVENALAALAAAGQLGIPLHQAAKSLSSCSGVPGRMEILSNRLGFTVMRDYAHTADSLEKVLSVLRHSTAGRLITVFGCPGQRDSTKRRAMGDIAGKYADFVVLTSDNPRQEDETVIAAQAAEGLFLHSTPFAVVLDREQAITFAFRLCQKGDLLLLAGKGHEEYQVLAGQTVYFNEKELVERLTASIEKRKGTAYNS